MSIIYTTLHHAKRSTYLSGMLYTLRSTVTRNIISGEALLSSVDGVALACTLSAVCLWCLVSMLPLLLTLLSSASLRFVVEICMLFYVALCLTAICCNIRVIVSLQVTFLLSVCYSYCNCYVNCGKTFYYYTCCCCCYMFFMSFRFYNFIYYYYYFIIEFAILSITMLVCCKLSWSNLLFYVISLS